MALACGTLHVKVVERFQYKWTFTLILTFRALTVTCVCFSCLIPNPVVGHYSANDSAGDTNTPTSESVLNHQTETSNAMIFPSPNNNSELSPEDSWGPKRDALCIVIPITVVYAVIFVSGLLGNTCTCIVIARNKHMHTATNYYLFSLAISDLLLLVSGIPHEIYSIWWRYPYVFGDTICVLQGVAAETSANATVLTITAFTVERYVAICHPFMARTLSRLSRAFRLVLVLWVAALGLAIPQALQFGVIHERLLDGSDHPEHSMCSIKRVLLPYTFEVSSVLFFVLPLSVISVLYVRIAMHLQRPPHRSSLRHATGNHSRPQAAKHKYNTSSRATRHVIKMLVAVVAAFFICWAPFHAQRLLAIHGYNGFNQTSLAVVKLYQALTYVSGILYFLSTSINPVLYHIMSNKFRDAFKNTLARCIGVKRRQLQEAPHRLSGISYCSRKRAVTESSAVCCHDRVNSLRYLEAEVARHEQRPLVVSFRRHSPPFETSSSVKLYLSTETQSPRPATYLRVFYRPAAKKNPLQNDSHARDINTPCYSHS